MKAENYQYSLKEIYEQANNLGNTFNWYSNDDYVVSKHTIKKLYEAFEKKNYQALKDLVCKIALASAKAGKASEEDYHFKYAISLLEAALKSPLADTKNNLSLKHILFKPTPYKMNFEKCIKECKKIHGKMLAEQTAKKLAQQKEDKIYGVYRARNI